MIENVPPKTEDIPTKLLLMQMFATTLRCQYLSPFTGGMVPAVRYAKRHGYDFRCDVLPANEMLDSIAPRDAHTWYKVAGDDVFFSFLGTHQMMQLTQLTK